MASPVVRFRAEDRRRQILAVATKLFARQGFQGTKTREIALDAGVNEALIFRHFPTKEELYWAVLEDKCKARRGREEMQRLFRSGRGLREVFAAIAEGMLRRNAQDSSFMRLWLFSGLEHHNLYRRFYRTYMADYSELLESHIRARIRSGEFRDVDPHFAAKGFIGMVVFYFLTTELFDGGRIQSRNASVISRELTDIWLAGMEKRSARNLRHIRNGSRRGMKAISLKTSRRKSSNAQINK